MTGVTGGAAQRLHAEWEVPSVRRRGPFGDTGSPGSASNPGPAALPEPRCEGVSLFESSPGPCCPRLACTGLQPGSEEAVGAVLGRDDAVFTVPAEHPDPARIGSDLLYSGPQAG